MVIDNIINSTNVGIILFLIGLYGLISKRNIIKMIIALNIMNGGITLFFIGLGYRSEGTAPILDEDIMRRAKEIVDPVPQALMLTDIVIVFCLTALALSLAIKIYQSYRTLELDELGK